MWLRCKREAGGYSNITLPLRIMVFQGPFLIFSMLWYSQPSRVARWPGSLYPTLPLHTICASCCPWLYLVSSVHLLCLLTPYLHSWLFLRSLPQKCLIDPAPIFPAWHESPASLWVDPAESSPNQLLWWKNRSSFRRYRTSQLLMESLGSTIPPQN